MPREMKDSGIEWIGDIPKHWNIIKYKYIISSNDGGVWGNDPLNDGNDKIVIRSTEQTIDGKWCITSPATRDLSEINLDNSRIELGDLLITKSSGSDLHIGKTTLADEYFESNECYFSNFIQRIRCNNYFPKLLWYLFNSNIVRNQFVYLQNSTSGIGNINAEIIENLILPSSPLSEQKAIADFLDKQCAEIDAVIEQTKATIEEYKKLKQSVITEAVTKGIRGNRPMKDSGIEWIGEIPADWDVVRIKTLFDYRNERNEKPLEEVNLISLYTDLGVVQHCDLEATTGNKATNADGYKLVYENDIVVNIILCWMGAIGRSAYTGVTSPAYDVYSPKEGTNSKFYHHLFRTQGFSGDCYKVGRGIMAMRWRTYSDQFRAIKVVAPPKEEQEEIIDCLDQKCAEIDALVTKKEQIVVELEAYKKSLIYEVVTGKREV